MTADAPRLALDLMVIGAAKSGTSSLIAMIHQAPDVAHNPAGSELTYFLFDEEHQRGVATAQAKYFDTPPDGRLLRVGKSAGLMYSQDALERLVADSPDVRPAVIVRNPVDRAFSAYLWARRAGVETEPFPDAIARELAGSDLDLPRPDLRRYIGRGEYARYLEVVQDMFGQLNVVTMEQFTDDPYACVNGLLAPFGRTVEPAADIRTHANRAAGVRSPALARAVRSRRLRAPLRRVLPARARATLGRTARRLNERPGSGESMDAATRDLLAEHFMPWNARLEQLLSRKLGWR